MKHHNDNKSSCCKLLWAETYFPVDCSNCFARVIYAPVSGSISAFMHGSVKKVENVTDINSSTFQTQNHGKALTFVLKNLLAWLMFMTLFTTVLKSQIYYKWSWKYINDSINSYHCLRLNFFSTKASTNFHTTSSHVKVTMFPPAKLEISSNCFTTTALWL